MTKGVRLASIDPGTRSVGFAVFTGGTLTEAGLCVPDVTVPPWLRDLDVIVVEQMQVYVQSKQKGDPNDLISVAQVAGEFVGAARVLNPGIEAIYYRPSVWKRSVPKAVMGERILRALRAEERDKIAHVAKSLLHNAIDAVGLGLYELGRMRPS